MTGPNNYTRTAEGDQCLKLSRQLAAERKLRVAAEKNAMQMHALLIQARVRLVNCEKTAA